MSLTASKVCRNIVNDDKCNKKKLFSLIKDKRCDSSGISPLKKDGIQRDDPRDKADILNEQFSSVLPRRMVQKPLTLAQVSSLIYQPSISEKLGRQVSVLVRFVLTSPAVDG